MLLLVSLVLANWSELIKFYYLYYHRFSNDYFRQDKTWLIRINALDTECLFFGSWFYLVVSTSKSYVINLVYIWLLTIE